VGPRTLELEASLLELSPLPALMKMTVPSELEEILLELSSVGEDGDSVQANTAKDIAANMGSWVLIMAAP
jgi:hypothetical protein